MKRIICTLLIVMLAASVACAPKTAEPSVTAEPAAETQTAAPEETAAAAAEAPAATEAPAETAEPAAETAAEPEKPEPVVYETEITGPDTEGTEEPDVILDRYQDRLTLLDETNAEYSNITYYSTGGYNTYTMPGTYTADGNTIVFTDKTGSSVYTFRTDGNRLTETEYSYHDVAVEKVQGTYKNADYTLEIRADGSAELSSFRGIRYIGSIYELEDGTFEFMAYDEPTETSVDYVITLNGERFTMETFSHMRYNRFAGQYNMKGDLGEFVMTVDTEGNASAEINIFGRKTLATGYIYLGDEEQDIAGCTLNTDRGEQLYLSFGERIDDSINYYGTLSIILAAG